MAGYLCSKLPYLLLLLVAITVFSGGDARTLKPRATVSARIETLKIRFQIMDMKANTATWSYADIRTTSKPSVIQNITTSISLNGNKTAEVILRRFIREVDRFRNPIYLAYFDEKARSDTNASLSAQLSDLSTALNNTYYYAVRSVFRHIVPGKTPPPENLQWTRVYMENIIKAQNISRWKDYSLHELRTYATLRAFRDTRLRLEKLLSQLEKLVV